MSAPRLTRDQIGAVIASLIPPGSLVNLGIGLPSLAANFIPPDSGSVLSSENGVIGYGLIAPSELADPDVVNAGVQPVMLEPAAAIVDHATSFGIIRRGLIDLSVLGAYEVGSDRSFANWKARNDDWPELGGIGGAMDLAVGARRLIIALEHTTREGAPRLLERCTLPITGRECVDLVVTDLGVFRPTGHAYALVASAPGWSTEDIAALTGAPLAPTAATVEIDL